MFRSQNTFIHGQQSFKEILFYYIQLLEIPYNNYYAVQ